MESVSPVDFELVESHLSKYDSGEIFLSKDYYGEGIAIIYLNNPRKRNAISGKMMFDFRKCIDEIEKWKEGKCVLLCGLGENFCSGGDLDMARCTGTAEEGYYISSIMQDNLKRFRQLPLISVSLVHGATLGGGAELSIFSDYILMTDNVQLGFIHGKMGIITAFGATTRLIQLIGERKALEMLLTSKIYNAEQCECIGLANKIVSTANKIEEALDFVRQLTVHHYSIVRNYKKIAVFSEGEDFKNCLNFERDLFCPTWGSELNRTALARKLKHIKK